MEWREACKKSNMGSAMRRVGFYVHPAGYEDWKETWYIDDRSPLRFRGQCYISPLRVGCDITVSDEEVIDGYSDWVPHNIDFGFLDYKKRWRKFKLGIVRLYYKYRYHCYLIDYTEFKHTDKPFLVWFYCLFIKNQKQYL